MSELTQEQIACADCGMPLPKASTQFVYHPYAACLMFKACGDAATVQANLDAVVAYGYDQAYEQNPPPRREGM